MSVEEVKFAIVQKRHLNRKQYFLEQASTTKKFVLPYINLGYPINPKMRILEIGCGLGGNMVPFLEMGCETVGVDIDEFFLKNGKQYLQDFHPNLKGTWIFEDIYNCHSDQFGKFDLIMIRDVIEHIHNQERFLNHIKSFLKPQGKIFFGFPPWTMPFGGHQQICNSKWLYKLPFFHLLPKILYKFILKTFGESKETIQELVEIRQTRISTKFFLAILQKTGFQINQKTRYFINPNYETKFGLKPRELSPILSACPLLRDYFTTCMYALVSLK